MLEQIIIDNASASIAEANNGVVIQELGGSAIRESSLNYDISPIGNEQIKEHVQSGIAVSVSELLLSIDYKKTDIQLGVLSGNIKETRFAADGNFFYVGVALAPNTADTVKNWRIRRIDNAIAQSPIVLSAGGKDRFSFSWADRLTVVYA